MKKQILSEEFLRMQKLAGLITESEYKEKSNLKETSLSPEEQKIVDDIVNTLNEGEGWIEKLKSYAKKGVLTLGIVAALLGGASALNQDQKQEVADTIKKTELVSKEKDDIGYITDAWTAHSHYENHKNEIDKLAKEDSEVGKLVNDLTYKDWRKMSADEQAKIGEYNQSAIIKILNIK